VALGVAAVVSSATGYTLKDDLMPMLGGWFEEDPSFQITLEDASGQGPVIVKRCTDVTVKVTGELPPDRELWLGTDLRGRKAVITKADSVTAHEYTAQISIGRSQDHDQERQLVALLVSSDFSKWLGTLKDGASPYDVASGYWPPDAEVVATQAIRRNSTSTQSCEGKQ
jgi:hypothetical protein